MGKVNGANCAVCHTTRLKVGDYNLSSSAHGHPAEETFSFRKGASYPIWLQEISRQHLPTTNTGNTPITTAKYNANILPAIDGLPAGFVVQDPSTKLGTNQPWTNFPADPTVAIGTLIVPKIEVTWEDVPNSGVLETNPAPGGGFRYYPDQQSPTDNTDRRRLFVRVKTTPALPNQVVRLKSFDVDDPTPLVDDPFLIIDNTDGFGFQTGGDNRGATPTTPQAGLLFETAMTLDVLGEAVTFFTVTMQPGDNFRVAAVLDTPGAGDHLNALQVSLPFSEMHVAANDSPALGFVGALSPMLTVWRKPHLEFDSMAAAPGSGPEADYVGATVSHYFPNSPASGKSLVVLFHASGEPGVNLFANGKLEVPGGSSYRVTASDSRVASQNRIWTEALVDGVFSGPTSTNSLVYLYDDDDRFLANDSLFPSILGLQSPPLPALNYVETSMSVNTPKFASAYITLVNVNALGWNTTPTVPFFRHADIGLALARIFHSCIEERSGSGVTRLVIIEPNETAHHRFFFDRL